jgi:hypothetical protein
MRAREDYYLAIVPEKKPARSVRKLSPKSAKKAK